MRWPLLTLATVAALAVAGCAVNSVGVTVTFTGQPGSTLDLSLPGTARRCPSQIYFPDRRTLC